MDRAEFSVLGEPVPRPRQRHRILTKPNGTQIVVNYTPARHPVNRYKAEIQAAARTAWRLVAGPVMTLEPVQLRVCFVFPRLASTPKRASPGRLPYTSPRGDVDNLLKALQDAMIGIVYRDDGQIVRCMAERWRAAIGEAAATHVIVERIGEAEMRQLDDRSRVKFPPILTDGE